MADTNGQLAELLTRLQDHPQGFDFFNAVRQLEAQQSNLPRVGHARHPREDAVRFGQEVSLAFAPSSVADFRYDENGYNNLLVHFFGLLGANGPMPLHLTEYIHDREHQHRDPTFARFLDLFHHRMISLFYRAWSSSQQAVCRDRPKDDRFAMYVGSLVGFGRDSFLNRDSVQDEAKLYFAGRLAAQPRNAGGMRAILKSYFEVPTQITRFIDQMVRLPDQYRCRLGESPESGTLGSTAIVGARFRDCMQKFRIHFGSLSLSDYERFLPVGRSYARMLDWVRNYVGEGLEFEVQLVLKQQEVPSIQLGKRGHLGWTTWLKTQPFSHDADDLVLQTRLA